jgi:hypothetical protein
MLRVSKCAWLMGALVSLASACGEPSDSDADAYGQELARKTCKRICQCVSRSCDDACMATCRASDGGTEAPDASSTVDASTADAAPPPTGTSGLAARYPGDVGIASDPAVVFADDFESYGQASELGRKWDNYFQVSQTRIVTESANVYAGSKALEFNLPMQTSELSNGVQKILTTELEVLYLRYYSKFDKTFDVSGSSHNGGGISGHYFQGYNATPGIPADGTNKFLIEFECWRGAPTEKTPGVYNVYVYHPEQRSNYGDHFFTTGLVMPNTSIPFDFGPDFVPRPDIVPELDRWYEHEVMLKLNTPGQRDGRITIWLDGNVIGDFPNLRFRDISTLKIDRFNVSLHAGSNPKGATRKWYDNVVAATSYIGPMR